MTNPGVPDAPTELAPLTRKSRSGTAYFRRPELEQEIRKALGRPLQELLTSEPKVSDSCLLYFIRNFWPNGASRTHDAMVIEFLERMDRRVIGLARGVSRRREEIRLDIRQWFLEQLYTRSDRLDVYEYAPVRALKARVADRVDYYRLHDATEREEVSFLSQDEDGDAADLIDALNFRSNGPKAAHAEVMAELRELFALLRPQEREALLATEYLKLEQAEAGKILDVSARRLRQILKGARERIQKTREGEGK